MVHRNIARCRPVVEDTPAPSVPPVPPLTAEECRQRLFSAADTLSDDAVMRLWRFLEHWIRHMTAAELLLLGGYASVTFLL
jgi:hypothetical protein